MHRHVVVLLVASVCVAACGAAPAERRVEQIEKAAAGLQKSAESAAASGVEGVAKGFEDLAKGLSAMAGGDPNAKPVDPLTIEELKSALPELSGWEKGTATGERMKSPVNYAQARVSFRKGDAAVDVKIVDSALNQILVAPFAMFLAVGYEKETDTGYEKGVKIGEHPGWEKWDGEDRDGELNAIVNRRFIVQIEGRGIESMKVLHAAMEDTDLRKLSEAR